MSLNNIKSDLNKALLSAFNSVSDEWLPGRAKIQSKLEDFLGRTEIPFYKKPRYHKAAVDFLQSLWSENFPSKEYDDLLTILRHIERFFRKVKPEYKLRDHIVHTAYVFLTGLQIIQDCQAFQQLLETYHNLFDLWYWAASWHDLGYPAQLSPEGKNELYTRILEIERSPDSQTALKKQSLTYQDILSSAKRQNALYEQVESQIDRHCSVRGFLLQEDECTHAKVSCLASIICAARKLSTGNREKIRVLNNIDKSLVAVALHDCQGKHLKSPIQFGQNPILWLLILCDEIQHWNRPSGGEQHNLVPSEVVIEVKEGSKVVVDYRIEDKTDVVRKRTAIAKTIETLPQKISLSDACSFSILIDGKPVQ